MKPVHHDALLTLNSPTIKSYRCSYCQRLLLWHGYRRLSLYRDMCVYSNLLRLRPAARAALRISTTSTAIYLGSQHGWSCRCWGSFWWYFLVQVANAKLHLRSPSLNVIPLYTCCKNDANALELIGYCCRGTNYKCFKC